MDGVTILSTYEQSITEEANYVALACMIVGILSIFVILGKYLSWYFDEKYPYVVCIIIGCVLSIITTVGLESAHNKTHTVYETHYKAIIADNVYMNEFLDKYEIVGTEGEIYIIKNREKSADN